MLLKNGLPIAFAVSMAFVAPMPAMAQTTTVDTDAIAAACATSAVLCEAAIAEAIATLRAAGLSPAAINEQVGVIVSVAVTAARALPATERVILAGNIERVATESTNPAQRASLVLLAAAIASGEQVDLEAFAQAFSQS
jgi:hypothetical protein